MKFTSAVVLALAAGAVAQNSTTKAGKTTATAKASGSTTASAKATGGSGGKSNSTSTGAAKGTGSGGSSASATKSGSTPVQTTNGAPGIAASNAGGLVTIAGLGVAFALFM